jgi:outer membrane lipoprotein-sorting protein
MIQSATMKFRYPQLWSKLTLAEAGARTRRRLEADRRMRFEYAAPNPTLIVSDGSSVAVINKKLNTTDRITRSGRHRSA